MTENQFNNLDEMISSIKIGKNIEGVYASSIERDLTLYESIKEFFTSSWKDKLIFIAIIILVIILGTMGISSKILLIFIAIGVIVYMIIKRQQFIPGILIISKENVVLLNDISYDKSTNKFTLNKIQKYERNEIGKYFKFKQLNPLYHLMNKHFKLSDKEFVMTRKPLLFTKYFPTKNIVSFSKIKSLLHTS